MIFLLRVVDLTTKDSIINAQRAHLEILDARISQASETISNLNVGMTIAILIISTVTWYFGIYKPTQEIKNFKKIMDKKIHKYFKKQLNDSIDRAIEEVQKNDLIIASSSLNFLILTHPMDFSRTQFLKICRLIDEPDLKYELKNGLAMILTKNHSEESTEYFRKELSKGLQEWVTGSQSNGIYYFLNAIHHELFLDIFRQFILKTPVESRWQALSAILQNQMIQKLHMASILNDKQIVDAVILDNTVAQEYVSIKFYGTNFLGSIDFEATYFHQQSHNHGLIPNEHP